ncbi:Narbonolide/10-deoxymethynolide synthase PikA2, modules 3 and 4 [Paenibacillus sp. CECT 9249]|uniref:NAD(P)H-quinone oxidoreductase n=1 Tax=Paenibacillus sp. CECT 9249 TaxID=2845385 RepID=UPI001EF9C4F4|nr:Narbonolide/10-deoxymethynolide synthase PikA2, modules 3 and 4 [Paenibacillus sp. CECT 9249]
MMKALLVDQETKRLSVGEWETPVPGPDELLVEVKATALNRADLVQKRGGYPPPPGASPILGLEIAGIVERTGDDITDWQPGDRVFALLPGGGYAEKAVVPAGMAMRIPAGWTFEQAAAVPEVFLTAYLNLFQLGNVKAGQTVLIHAGASGVGTAAIQLAREAGARIFATAGTAEKRAACAALGADATFDYRSGPFADAVLEWTGGNGADLILDFVGAAYWKQNMKALALEGALVLIGTMGGGKVEEVDLLQLMMRRQRVIGSTLRSQTVAQKTELTRKFAEFAMPRLLDGRLKPVIDSVWDAANVNEAHERMEKNENTGKIVLRMNLS